MISWRQDDVTKQTVFCMIYETFQEVLFQELLQHSTVFNYLIGSDLQILHDNRKQSFTNLLIGYLKINDPRVIYDLQQDYFAFNKNDNMITTIIFSLHTIKWLKQGVKKKTCGWPNGADTELNGQCIKRLMYLPSFLSKKKALAMFEAHQKSLLRRYIVIVYYTQATLV